MYSRWKYVHIIGSIQSNKILRLRISDKKSKHSTNVTKKPNAKHTKDKMVWAAATEATRTNTKLLNFLYFVDRASRYNFFLITN